MPIPPLPPHSLWDRPEPTAAEPPAPSWPGRDAWLMLGIGAALAVVCLAEPHLRWVLSYLTTLIHELGHVVVGWLFGYPSLPAFDFTYGGGITTYETRSALLLGFVYLCLGGLAALYWRNRLTLVVLGAAIGLLALCAHTHAHQAIILFMGHGMELALAGVFLYRAMGSAAILHAAERPVYAACGFFIVFSDAAFAWRLWANPLARRLYEDAKGGGHWMDFSQLADHYFRVSLPTVAFIFLLCCALPLVLSLLAHRYQSRLAALMVRLFRRDGPAGRD
ncbi:MAG TPA: hypothetical protein VNE39_03860 [Planctomycetota bacterium]|nr:hypothetical protein [Planctomycetota bacterium]